jgi:hypothetical protein
MDQRRSEERTPEPLRVPPPLNELPWDIAQDQFGVQGADFIGHMGIVLLRAAQDQFKAYIADSKGAADTLQHTPAQDQIRPVQESVRVGRTSHETGVSSAGPPL